ncbi:MAG: TRIC cation channel family protein [Solirubrobacteraceae bacterium]|nr:TRIC cation channel family protein [Solirubrobacteraceae bacterium]
MRPGSAAGGQVAERRRQLTRSIAPSTQSIILGAITGVGGGMVRDLLLRQVPNVLRADLYAVPALLGATVVVVQEAGAETWLFPLVGVVSCVAVRLVAVRHGIGLPIAPSERRSDPPPDE